MEGCHVCACNWNYSLIERKERGEGEEIERREREESHSKG